MMRSPVRIAVSIGDPNGIGPEIAVKAAAVFARKGGPEPILVGDEFVIRDYLTRCAIELPLVPLDDAGHRGISFVAEESLPPASFRPGLTDPSAGRATVAYVRRAVDLVRSGAASAVVACPHSETAINSAGIPFTGYPGLLAELTGRKSEDVYLMLVAAGLRICHVTLHESLRDAIDRLTPDLIVSAGMALAEALKRLDIENPSIGVFGINPHAGEGGLFGDDDERITKPAVDRLRRLGVHADGPVGADVLLAQRKHNAYLAMYHDQGHIPIKLVSPHRSAAMAIGTEILFSSVGHGSAFDIAGQGIADPISVIEAMELLGTAAARQAAAVSA
jgi:4-hydroxy-L-threonine phosphate dehydrogenase PdxA